MELSAAQRAIIASLLVLALGAAGVVGIVRSRRPGVSVENGAASAAQMPPGQTSRTITVHVVGAVARPGVYVLQAGSRAQDAVAIAGGPSADADLTSINLASPLADGQQVFVPARGQPQVTPTAPVPAVRYPDSTVPTSAATTPLPAGPGDGSPPAETGLPAVAQPAQPASPHKNPPPPPLAAPPQPDARIPAPPPTSKSAPKPASVPVRFPLSINRASESELQALPRIGPALAERIVQYRNTHGPFRSLDELTNVSGIGPKTLAEISRYLTL